MIILFSLIIFTRSQLLQLDNFDELTGYTDVQNISSDQLCMKYLRKSNKTLGRRVLYHTMIRGWNKSSIQLINRFNNLNIDIYEVFHWVRQEKHNPILFEQLSRLLPEHSHLLNIIEPCYQWAQNMTHLLIKIKFSSKIDVPGAQLINNLQVNITMPQLFINAYSFDYMNRYVLNIKTYKFMNPHYYAIHHVELGQIILEILKSPSPYFWKNIHSKVFYNPPNQYIWWDMYYQYREQLQVAFGLLEEAENKREENEMKNLWDQERSISDDRQFKAMQENDNELSIQLNCRQCEPLDPEQWSSWVI